MKKKIRGRIILIIATSNFYIFISLYQNVNDISSDYNRVLRLNELICKNNKKMCLTEIIKNDIVIYNRLRKTLKRRVSMGILIQRVPIGERAHRIAS
jgi:hypothetical protein